MDEPIAQEQPAADSGARIEPPVEELTIEGLEPGMTIMRRVRGPRRWPGILACVLAVLMLVATALAIALSAQLQYAAATDLAYLAIALSAAAVVMGLIAIFGRWARGAGIVGALVAVLGNPLVLLYGLNYFGGN